MKDDEIIVSLRAIIEDCMRDGGLIDVDGIGTLELDTRGEIIFKRNGRPRIFLAYAFEDQSAIRQLYLSLHNAGFEPWMDVENLLPGQNWPRAIERAIETADYFVGCFSSRSSVKRGHFQSELSYALLTATRAPAEQVFFVPLRLDKCEIPPQIERNIHYLDLFPDWDRGVKLLIRALREHEKSKKRPTSKPD